jgi:hypothetical protein
MEPNPRCTQAAASRRYASAGIDREARRPGSQLEPSFWAAPRGTRTGTFGPRTGWIPDCRIPDGRIPDVWIPDVWIPNGWIPDRRLKAMIPDIQVFLDVDDLLAIGQLDSYIDKSSAVLAFLTESYMQSKNCLIEL